MFFLGNISITVLCSILFLIQACSADWGGYSKSRRLHPCHESSLYVHTAEKSPTCGQILPIIKKLKAHLTVQDGDTVFISNIKKKGFGQTYPSTTRYQVTEADRWRSVFFFMNWWRIYSCGSLKIFLKICLWKLIPAWYIARYIVEGKKQQKVLKKQKKQSCVQSTDRLCRGRGN